MNGIDMDHLRMWIGVEDEATDIVTAGLSERFAATFAGLLPDQAAAPPGIHWCLAPPAAPADALGNDGHPKRGGFLPPVPLQRRMWAGGEVTFLTPIETGDRVTRRARIADVAHKSGRTGELVFVTVEHELTTTRGVAIRERQDLVYRQAADGRATSAPAPSPVRIAEFSETIACNSVMLLRYSALTFNGHRIHYDRAYAANIEHYAGLVVHGPLQATCLMNFAARLDAERRLHKVTYRGVSPLVEGNFTLNANRGANGFDLWTTDGESRQAMIMSVAFQDRL